VNNLEIKILLFTVKKWSVDSQVKRNSLIHCNNAIVILTILFVIILSCKVEIQAYEGTVYASLETGVTRYCNN